MPEWFELALALLALVVPLALAYWLLGRRPRGADRRPASRPGAAPEPPPAPPPEPPPR